MIHILYVDDEPALLHLGKLSLEKSGELTVDTVQSADEAIRILRDHTYDAVVSDYQMPEMDGIAFLKYIRPRCSGLPFILFTGKGREEVVIEAINNGADFYLQKGGDPKSQFAELTHKIKKAVEQNRAKQALSENEELLRATLESTNSGILVVDNQQKVSHYNKKFVDMWKIPPEILGSRDDRQFLSYITGQINRPEEFLARVHELYQTLTSDIDMIEFRDGRIFERSSMPLVQKGSVKGRVWNFVDITDRKRAELLVNEAGERYRTLISVSNTGAWEFHHDTGFLWCSPEYFSMLGRDPGMYDMSGKRNLDEAWISLIHPEDRDRAARHFSDYLINGSGGLYENHFRMQHANGSWVWILSRGRTLTDDFGRLTNKTIGTHIDITERKEAEDALATSEQKYRSLFDSASDAIFLLDNGRFIDCNEKAVQLFQIPREKLVNSSPFSFSPRLQPDGSESRIIAMEKEALARSGTPQFFEWTHCRPDGTLIDVEVSLNRVDAGTTMLIQAIVRDITQRKQAEKELLHKHEELTAAYQQIEATDEVLRHNLDILVENKRQLVESEHRYRSLIENIPDVVWTSTREGRMTFISPDVKGVYGYSPEEIYKQGGALFFDRVHPDDREAVKESYLALFETKSLDIEYRVQRADGRWIWLRNRAIGTYEKDGELFADGIFSDITEHKEADRLIRESENLFRTVFENTGTATIIIRNDTIIEFANSVFEELSGYSKQDIEGKRSWTEFVVREDLEWMKRHHGMRRTDPAVPKIYEFRYVDRSGNIRNCVNNVRMIPGTDRSVASIIDVTEQKKVEAALRDSEAQYRTIIENVQDIFYRVDMQGNIRMVSPTGVTLLGYDTPENLVGKVNISELYADPGDRTKLLAEMEKNRQVTNYPITLIARDDTPRYVTTSSHYYSDKSGAVLGIEGIIHDITGQKKAEEELIRLNETLSRQTRILSILNRVIAAANTATDFHQLLADVLDKTLSLLDYDAGGIYIVDPGRKTASVISSRFLPDDFLAEIRTLSIDTPPYDLLFRRGEVVITDHYEQVSPKRAEATGFCSVASVPFYSKDRISGALNVISKRRYVVSPEERQTLLMIGQELGNAIERVTAEEESKNSAANLRLLFNSIDEMVFILDLEGKIIRVNEAVRKRLQYTQDELFNMDVLSLHVPERRDEALGIIRGMIEGSIDSCPVPVVAKDGTRIEVETKVTRGKWDNRDVLIGVSRDISERIRSERERDESETKYRVLLQSANDVVLVHEITELAPGKILEVNEKACELYGYTRDELLDMTIPDLDAPYYSEIIPLLSRQVFYQDRAIFEMDQVTKDGRVITVEVSVRKVYFGGRPVALAIIHDISERKRAEQALRESEEKYRVLFLESSDPIFSFSPDGTYQYVNRAFADSFGKTTDEITGKKIRDLFPPDEAERRVEILSRVFSTGERMEIEGPVQTVGGTRYYLTTLAPVRDVNGEVISAICSSKDITTRRMAENALLKANRQLSLLAGITRHDILNRVTIILGYLELAGEESDDPAMRDFLEKIRYTVCQIRSEIEFTRIYRDIGTNEPQWQELEKILPRSQDPGTIRLEAGIADTELYADPMLERVFSNLLDNSLRHGERVTTITVSARHTGDALMVTWEDDGAGIPAAEKEKIFYRGYGKNTGLGLFLVREILSLAGITIKETGIQGKGARFEMTVPKEAWRKKKKNPPE